MKNLQNGLETMLKRKTKISDNVITEISKEIHSYVAYSTLSMYYTIRKLLEQTSTDKEKEEASDMINKMMITAESLFDDLTDKQKELYNEMAMHIIQIIHK